MLDDKLLVEYVKYISTKYSSEHQLVAKIKYYGFNIFNLKTLTSKEKKILIEAKEKIEK